jgi:hypothetical protein
LDRGDARDPAGGFVRGFGGAAYSHYHKIFNA